ncbi:MAG: hypothetical protein JWR35_1123 [Marmoricola sp.]|nr:hypothetical protein [Marmoricola sp.]
MEDVYEAPPFTAADHTKLVKAVLDRPLHVIKYLDVPSGHAPTNLEVVDAALQVKSFDDETKARLRAARAGYLRFEEERAGRSASFTAHLERVHAALEGKSITEMIAAVDTLLAQEHLDDHAAAGLQLAKAILIDGADSIYAPDYPVYELLETVAFTGAQQVAQVDADFAAAGGGGSSGGAAAGLGSVGAAIAVIYGAFFD